MLNMVSLQLMKLVSMNTPIELVDRGLIRKGHDVLAEGYLIRHLFNDSDTWDGSCGVCNDVEAKLVVSYISGWQDGYTQGVEENKPPF